MGAGPQRHVVGTVLVAAMLATSAGCSSRHEVHVGVGGQVAPVEQRPAPYRAVVAVREQRGGSVHDYRVVVDFKAQDNWSAEFQDDSRFKDGIRIDRGPGRYRLQQPSYDPHDLLTQDQIDNAVSKMSPDQWQAALAALIDSGKLSYRLRTEIDEREIGAGSYTVPADLPVLDAVGRGAVTWASDMKLREETRSGNQGRVFTSAGLRLELNPDGRPVLLVVDDSEGPVLDRTEYRVAEFRRT